MRKDRRTRSGNKLRYCCFSREVSWWKTRDQGSHQPRLCRHRYRFRPKYLYREGHRQTSLTCRSASENRDLQLILIDISLKEASGSEFKTGRFLSLHNYIGAPENLRSPSWEKFGVSFYGLFATKRCIFGCLYLYFQVFEKEIKIRPWTYLSWGFSRI